MLRKRAILPIELLKRQFHQENWLINQDPALEMRRGGNSTVGSNPTLSAISLQGRVFS